MPHAALIAFALIALTMTGAILARRLHVPASIFLVVFGIAASFVPGLPHIPIEPNVVLQVLLPPLLYIAGVGMSWRGFKREFAEISLLAVGCVCATAAAVAFTVHGLLGWPLALGFVLGAIVAPPDAVAPLALTEGLALPQRIVTILEGEGLVNDATALIIFSFAVTAVETASFSLPQATGLFVIVAIAGVAWGLAVGWGTLRLRRAIGDPQIELTIALLAPYIAFWPLQALGGSGVLAAVTAGLYVSANGAGSIPPATRLQGYFFWRLVVYITEGSIFVITGLQARPILETLQKDSWQKLPLAIGVVILAVVAVRLIWVVVLTRVPRDLIRKSKHKAPPPWQHDFFIGFTGIRGVVSLAAALSIPFMVDGAPFPERDIVLIITFAVILATLVGQGLSLPWLVRKLGLDAEGRREFGNGEGSRDPRPCSRRRGGADATWRAGRHIGRDDARSEKPSSRPAGYTHQRTQARRWAIWRFAPGAAQPHRGGAEENRRTLCPGRLKRRSAPPDRAGTRSRGRARAPRLLERIANQVR